MSFLPDSDMQKRAPDRTFVYNVCWAIWPEYMQKVAADAQDKRGSSHITSRWKTQK